MMWSSMFNPESPRPERKVDMRRIGRFFLPYWREEALILLCIVVVSVLGLLPPLFTKWLIDDAIPKASLHLILLYVGGMIASAILAGVIGVVQGYLNSYVGEGIMRDIRTSLVSHLHRMPIAFFTNTKTGEIMNRVSNDVDNIDNIVTGTLVSIVTNIVTIVTTVVTIFVLDWRLALISVSVIPLMIFPLSPVGRRMYAVRKRTRYKRDEIESITQETLSISGITLIKSFVREQFERNRFFRVANELMRLEIDLAMIGRWFIMVIGAMVVIGPAFVWLGGSWFAIHGSLTVGTIVAFVVYLNRLYTPASTLAGIQVQIVSAAAVFERIFDYLDMPTEAAACAGTALLEAVRGEIVFEDVSFSYGERAALHHVSFRIAPGQTAALVGPSGAGKTTITQLVPRFFIPQAGRITIDGHDICDLDLTSLRNAIGIVTQETYLFHDTIAANLRYGRMDASDADLIEAAKAANIHDFIASLPEGYETVAGERGHKLSGGERQRLALARVLLKDPRILILDEATSSLDSHNESMIQTALERVMRNRTSLVIAHRLSTIISADVIFVVEGGRIVESGTHAVLLARGGTYAHLYREQFRDQMEEVGT
ncbi:MAG: ABC transporter ATP-binding protein [Candidatus Eremiobacteraeota bacterium]|nr:ABC transporter ATP-binding protein [Candidatus Eremiobacteraeota bacterium]